MSLRRECEGGDAADAFVDDERAGEGRGGALRAGGPLAEAAVYSDRRRVRRGEVEAPGIDEARGVFQFASEADREVRFRRAPGGDGTLDRAREREPLRAVGKLDD